MPQEENSGVSGLSEARLDSLSNAPKCSREQSLPSLPLKQALAERAIHSFTCLCLFAAVAGVLQTPARQTDPTSCISHVHSSLQTSLATLAAVSS